MSEYLRHVLIRTPVYDHLAQWKYTLNYPLRRRHPELRDIHAEPGRIHEMLRRVLRQDSNCVDVGAHLGATLRMMVRLAPAGSHHAVDALCWKACWLQRSFPEVKVHCAALWDTQEMRTFYEDTRHSQSSGMRPCAVSNGHTRKHEVQCVPLDSLLPPGYRIDFLRVDVNGAELPVLRGAESLLKAHRPAVLFKCANSDQSAYGISTRDIFQFLTGTHGYDVFTVADWLRDGTPLSRPDFIQATLYPFRAFNFLAVSRAAAAN